MRQYAGFSFVKTLNGGPPVIKNMPAVAGTYTEGMVLRLSATTGSVAAQSASGTAIYGVCSANVSRADSATTRIPVIRADEYTLFEAKMLASVAPQSKVGDTCDLAVGSTYNYRLAATSSLGMCKIHEFHPDESLSAHTGARFRVAFAKNLISGTERVAKG